MADHSSNGSSPQRHRRSDWTKFDEDGIKRPALPLTGYYRVPDEEQEPGQPPTSGLQYLRMVRAEAEACPQVVRVAPPPTAALPPNIPDLRAEYFSSPTSSSFSTTTAAAAPQHQSAQPPAHLTPSPEWTARFLDRFAFLHDKLVQHRETLERRRAQGFAPPKRALYRPAKQEERAWRAFCYGAPAPRVKAVDASDDGGNAETDGKRKREGGVPLGGKKPREGDAKTDAMDLGDDEEEEDEDGEAPTAPSVDELQLSNAVALEREPLLDIVCALEQGDIIRLLELHIKWMTAANSMMEEEGQWLFALLLRLDPLLVAEEMTIVRDLCRLCRTLRVTMADELTPEDPRAASLNMVIAIVAGAFGQKDLGDSGAVF
ncbi:gem (nuclear organelle) associated protein 2 [Geranomyces variabilis]|uniref:Gem (Nuclear organelle) associated protein 2 n=1 Tax=Geranomyces variabilis TaxID=109894 RepID=A0AAD5TQZ0_9FUNG|nr:gem (nuclear organelle) associated protein 2 [Geranomyces variabilis]